MDLTKLKSLLYDIIEEIEELEYNTPERIAEREAYQKWIKEHPEGYERYGIFSPDLWSKKMREQIFKSGVLDDVE